MTKTSNSKQVLEDKDISSFLSYVQDKWKKTVHKFPGFHGGL